MALAVILPDEKPTFCQGIQTNLCVFRLIPAKMPLEPSRVGHISESTVDEHSGISLNDHQDYCDCAQLDDIKGNARS